MKHIILYSGGLDSFITAEYVKQNKKKSESMELVYLPLGHKYQRQEMSVANSNPDATYLPGLDALGAVHEEEDGYIWQRNAFLCLLAAKRIPKEEWGKIWLTVQKDETSLSDRSPQFFKIMTDLLIILGVKTVVDTPWWEYDKTDMVRWYLMQDGASVEDLKKTHSCYRPAVLPCGDCSACVRRFIAMKLNGVEEEYEIDPRYSSTGKEYLNRARDGHYSANRNYKTQLALEVSDETK